MSATQVACALRYAPEVDEAPVLVSSGEGELAVRIRRAAEQFGIPVVQNFPLARALIELPLGEAIPEELFVAVAEILHTIWLGEEP